MTRSRTKTPSKNELVFMCREDGIPAHKGMTVDVLWGLAFDEAEFDVDMSSSLDDHRDLAERAIAGIPELHISGCTSVCPLCTEAETVNCHLECGHELEKLLFIRRTDMKWTKKKLEEKTEQQLRGICRRDFAVPRAQTMTLNKEAIIELILEKQAEAAGGDEQAAEPEEAAEPTPEETTPDAEEQPTEPEEDAEPAAEEPSTTTKAVKDKVKNLQTGGGAGAAAAKAAAIAGAAAKKKAKDAAAKKKEEDKPAEGKTAPKGVDARAAAAVELTKGDESASGLLERAIQAVIAESGGATAPGAPGKIEEDLAAMAEVLKDTRDKLSKMSKVVKKNETQIENELAQTDELDDVVNALALKIENVLAYIRAVFELDPTITVEDMLESQEVEPVTDL